MPSSEFRAMPSAMPGVDAVEARSARSFPRHTHEQFGIGFILQGAQKSASGRGQVEAGPGDVITVNPGEIHDGAPIGDHGRWWRMLYFDPTVLAEAFGDVAGGCGPRQWELPRPVLSDPRTMSLIRVLFERLTTKDPDAALQGEELLLSLLKAIESGNQPGSEPDAVPAPISTAKAMIDDAPSAALTLADLARASSLSKFQVLRGFVSATGFTPHAYLLQRRLDVARRLIGDGMPLAQAAADAGFADQSHMTRVFVSRYGISPGAYAAAAGRRPPRAILFKTS